MSHLMWIYTVCTGIGAERVNDIASDKAPFQPKSTDIFSYYSTKNVIGTY